jgi:hypothetical protein
MTDKHNNHQTSSADKASRDISELVARWGSIQIGQYANPLTEGGRDDGPIFVTSSDGDAKYWIATNGDSRQQISVYGNQFLDIRHMKVGAASPLIIMTYKGAEATLITDKDNHLVAPNSLIEVRRDALGAYHFNVISGFLTPAGGKPTPVCDCTLITAGQSLAARFIQGSSLHGFQKGWKDYTGNDTTKFWTVNGAIGGSGLVPASNAANYWWDPATDMPGPNALGWKAALDTIPSIQPAPSAILWIFGQTDAGRIGSDPSLSLTCYKATLKKVLRWLQDQINPRIRTPVILAPVGAWDQPYDTGVQSVRWVEMELIEETASFHLGPAYFDLPRPWDDVHHNSAGQKLLGYRMAAILDNVLNDADHRTGPEVIGIEELAGGQKYRLKIRQHGSGDFTRPLLPEGFAAYQSGANPLLDVPIDLTGFEWERLGGGIWTLSITLDTASAGATILFPAGACAWARRGLWPMNVRNDRPLKGFGNVWPLRPFKSKAF